MMLDSRDQGDAVQFINPVFDRDLFGGRWLRLIIQTDSAQTQESRLLHQPYTLQMKIDSLNVLLRYYN